MAHVESRLGQGVVCRIVGTQVSLQVVGDTCIIVVTSTLAYARAPFVYQVPALTVPHYYDFADTQVPFTSAAAAIMCALLSQGLAVTPHHLFACWGGICHTSGGTCLACGMCHVWGDSGRAHCSFSGFVREYHAYMCVWSVHFARALSRALADGAHHLRTAWSPTPPRSSLGHHFAGPYLYPASREADTTS